MNNKNSVRAFYAENRIDVKDEELIGMALIHPSYSQEHNLDHNNQRLEFLGDAILDFVVAEYLYIHYPHMAEGDLTQIRARVVCEKALVEIAVQIHVGEYILLGKGEDMSGGRKRKSILADTVEALIGAIYMDQGVDKAREFIMRYLEQSIIDTAQGDYQDYKSRLQEIVQASSKENVHYEILEESGPAHARNFVAGVFLHGRLLASGQGKSKKEAEQNAAEIIIKDSALLKHLQ